MLALRNCLLQADERQAIRRQRPGETLDAHHLLLLINVRQITRHKIRHEHMRQQT